MTPIHAATPAQLAQHERIKAAQERLGRPAPPVVARPAPKLVVVEKPAAPAKKPRCRRKFREGFDDRKRRYALFTLRQMWPHYDTVSIAKACGMPEAYVANLLARYRDAMRETGVPRAEP